VLVIIGLVSLTYLNGFKSMPRSNQAFDYKTYKIEQDDKQKVLEEIEHKRLAALEPKEEVIVVKAVFKVDLNTEGLRRGNKLYSKCIVCHGKLGEGKKSQNAPKIGGQFEQYIVTQIKNIKSGIRVNKVMNPYVKRLSVQDINDLGEYIAKLPW